jgi:hypothetical protein
VRATFPLVFLLLLNSAVASAATINVDCGLGQTINGAVFGAAPGDRIEVTGSCVELVFVNGKDNLTIDGNGVATLTGVAILGSRPTLDVSNSRGFVLEFMTVNGYVHSSGDPSAIRIVRSEATIRDCTVQNAEAQGIQLSDNSSLSLQRSIIQMNAGPGVGVGAVSSLTLMGDNTNTGIDISNNGGDGINVGQSSNLSGGGNHRIQNNGGRGINVQYSSVQLGGEMEVSGNGGQGVFLISSSGDLRGFLVDGNNQQPQPGPPVPMTTPFPGLLPCGICLHTGSNLFLFQTEITNEPGAGLLLRANGSATVTNLLIHQNTGDGVHIEAASGVLFLSPGMGPATVVDDNGDEDIECVDTDLSWVAGDTKYLKAQGCKVLKPKN